jgi:hypothetical protein
MPETVMSLMVQWHLLTAELRDSTDAAGVNSCSVGLDRHTPFVRKPNHAKGRIGLAVLFAGGAHVPLCLGVDKWEQRPDVTTSGVHSHDSNDDLSYSKNADDVWCQSSDMVTICSYGNYENERAGSGVASFHLSHNCDPNAVSLHLPSDLSILLIIDAPAWPVERYFEPTREGEAALSRPQSNSAIQAVATAGLKSRVVHGRFGHPEVWK